MNFTAGLETMLDVQCVDMILEILQITQILI